MQNSKEETIIHNRVTQPGALGGNNPWCSFTVPIKGVSRALKSHTLPTPVSFFLHDLIATLCLLVTGREHKRSLTPWWHRGNSTSSWIPGNLGKYWAGSLLPRSQFSQCQGWEHFFKTNAQSSHVTVCYKLLVLLTQEHFLSSLLFSSYFKLNIYQPGFKRFSPKNHFVTWSLAGKRITKSSGR